MKTKPANTTDLISFRRNVAVAQLATAKFPAFEHELIPAGGIPAPTMEGADDPPTVERAGAFAPGPCRDAAHIMIGLDRFPIGSHHQDRLVADVVNRVIVDIRNLIDARGDLPHLAPELLVLELLECRIDIAPDADAVRLRVPTGRPLRSMTGGWGLGRCCIGRNVHHALRD